MAGALGGEVVDLLATGDPADGDAPVAFVLSLNGGEKFQATHGLGHLVVLGLEAEGAGHPAAGGIYQLGVDAGDGERLHGRVGADEGFLVTVAVDLERRKLMLSEDGLDSVGLVFGELDQQFVKHHGLAGDVF